jgi:hypothetical protein
MSYPTTVAAFETGRCYRMSWVTDAQAETFWVVMKRTAKTVTLYADGWGLKTCRVRYNVAFESEEAAPLGRASLAPVLLAERVWTPALEA